MPTDTELIAAVAKLKGWTQKGAIPSWYDPEGNCTYSLPSWLNSIDACLALLDKPWAMQQFSDGNVFFTIYEGNKTWEVIEDMEPGMSQVQVRCRAILLALLEVGE